MPEVIFRFTFSIKKNTFNLYFVTQFATMAISLESIEKTIQNISGDGNIISQQFLNQFNVIFMKV